MRFLSFTIKDFKGIKDCTIDVDRSGLSVFSLIGLNESGKTTILEAINYFVAADKELQKLYEIESENINKASFVPKHQKSNFNGEIKIIAKIELEASDIEELKRVFLIEGYKLKTSSVPRTFSVTQHFDYKNSDYVKEGRNWAITPTVTNIVTGESKEIGVGHPCWTKLFTTIRDRFPQICYFPTFLFELPDRIYLEKKEDETATNSYYRRLIQDVLDSLGKELNIETHIIKRIRSKPNNWTWFSFLESDQREQVTHVLLQASTKITKVVMESWKRVFNRSLDNKRIELEYGHDELKDAIYVKLYLIDGSEKYDIGDRSLGFRWFFCFWLFTHFRTLRNGTSGTVFLLDEPASNLHARAQEELLSNLESLANDKNIVIYSTHSHYLVNPKWLDGSYIVANGAVNYDGIEDEFSSSGETDISAISYRKFVSSHPNQRTYFLPILDSLDYRPSELTLERPTLLVEGKADFCFFKLLSDPKKDKFSIVPGNGAKSLDPLISMLTGWGVPFVILLDDDKEGRDARAKYFKNWGISGEEIKTISDFHSDFSGKSLENIILEDAKSIISSHFGSEKIDKSQAQLFLYELLAKGQSANFGDRLTQLSKGSLDWARQKLLC
jgi:predicted ATP-dependent endonuclease of OLD family